MMRVKIPSLMTVQVMRTPLYRDQPHLKVKCLMYQQKGKARKKERGKEKRKRLPHQTVMESESNLNKSCLSQTREKPGFSVILIEI